MRSKIRSYTQEPCYVKQGNEANEGIIANTKHKKEIDHIYIVVTLFSFEGTSKIFAKEPPSHDRNQVVDV